MQVEVLVADILDVAADVLICPANPWLNLSGGLGGAILQRGGESIQIESQEHLSKQNLRAIPAGSVVVTNAKPLAFKWIVHAVAIDPFYESSVELVRQTLRASLELAASRGATSVAVPALATGYGRLSMEDSARAAALVVTSEVPQLSILHFVFRTEENANIFREIALAAQ